MHAFRVVRLSRFVALIAAVSMSVAAMTPALAQSTTTTTTPAKGDESGLTVSPAIVENTVDAGTVFDTEINLGNITPRAVPIDVTTGPLDSDQRPDIADQAKYDISSWFKVDPASFLLESQARNAVKVTVAVPKDAEPGGHYATVFFGALAANSETGETLLNARVGVVFLVTVRGEIKPAAELTGPIRTDSWQWDAGATSFHLGIKNTGNIHFQPQGEIVVKDLFGRKVKTLPLPVGYVLPGGHRDYDVNWERGMRPGVYTASVKIAAGVPLKANSKRFVLAPLVIVIPVLVLAALVFLGIWRARARKKRRLRRRAAVEAITAAEPGEELFATDRAEIPGQQPDKL